MDTNARKRQRMSYESLKSVLVHMEANKRFEIARRMPSIRNVEKLVPLTIDHLSFDRFKMKINDTSYQLGIIRELQEGHVIDYANEYGGYDHDCDEFGFREISDDMIVTPGDVQMEHDGFETKHTKEDSQRELDSYENAILGRNEARRYPLDHEITRGRIHLLQCHLNDTPPPYTAFLQLTVVKDDEDKTIERAPYNTKLYLAMKSLATQFFGNRKHPILVKKFKIEHPIEMTIRLPFGIKFHIQHLQLPKNIARCLKELDPIIHESSYPFNQFTISRDYSVEDFETTTVQNAKKFVFGDGAFDDILKLLPMNSHTISSCLHSDYAVNLVAFWLETQKPIGYCFVVNNTTGQEALGDLRTLGEEEQFEFEVKQERLLVIPINDTSKINIIAEATGEELMESDWEPWIVKFEVIPAGDN